MKRTEWTFGRCGHVYEPNPDIEDLTVHCGVWASPDGAGARFSERVTMVEFNWGHHKAGGIIAYTMQQTALAVVRKATRMMRKREQHGLPPWLHPEMFRHRSYKGVSGIG